MAVVYAGGIMSALVAQICANDLVGSWVALVEMSSVVQGSWGGSQGACSAFLGLHTLANTATPYLLVLLNLHTVSAPEARVPVRSPNNPLTGGGLTPRSGRITSALLPSALVWLLCVSLAVPHLSAATLLHRPPLQMCVVDYHHRSHHLGFLLLAFRVALPVSLLLLTFFLVLSRGVPLLRLPLVLDLLYFTFSSQTLALYAFHIFYAEDHHRFFPRDVLVASSLLHYLNLVLRPVLCASVFSLTFQNACKRCACTNKHKE